MSGTLITVSITHFEPLCTHYVPILDSAPGGSHISVEKGGLMPGWCANDPTMVLKAIGVRLDLFGSEHKWLGREFWPFLAFWTENFSKVSAHYKAFFLTTRNGRNFSPSRIHKARQCDFYTPPPRKKIIFFIFTIF